MVNIFKKVFSRKRIHDFSDSQTGADKKKEESEGWDTKPAITHYLEQSAVNEQLFVRHFMFIDGMLMSAVCKDWRNLMRKVGMFIVRKAEVDKNRMFFSESSLIKKMICDWEFMTNYETSRKEYVEMMFDVNKYNSNGGMTKSQVFFPCISTGSEGVGWNYHPLERVLYNPFFPIITFSRFAECAIIFYDTMKLIKKEKKESARRGRVRMMAKAKAKKRRMDTNQITGASFCEGKVVTGTPNPAFSFPGAIYLASSASFSSSSLPPLTSHPVRESGADAAGDVGVGAGVGLGLGLGLRLAGNAKRTEKKNDRHLSAKEVEKDRNAVLLTYHLKRLVCWRILGQVSAVDVLISVVSNHYLTQTIYFDDDIWVKMERFYAKDVIRILALALHVIDKTNLSKGDALPKVREYLLSSKKIRDRLPKALYGTLLSLVEKSLGPEDKEKRKNTSKSC
jgi:hypothetical protein